MYVIFFRARERVESEKYVLTCPKEYVCPKNLLVKAVPSVVKGVATLSSRLM